MKKVIIALDGPAGLAPCARRGSPVTATGFYDRIILSIVSCSLMGAVGPGKGRA